MSDESLTLCLVSRLRHPEVPQQEVVVNHPQGGTPQIGRDLRFKLSLRERLHARKRDWHMREFERLAAHEPADDRPDHEWLAWHRRWSRHLDLAHTSLVKSVRRRQTRARRAPLTVTPRGRREHAPAPAARRTSSSS